MAVSTEVMRVVGPDMLPIKRLKVKYRIRLRVRFLVLPEIAKPLGRNVAISNRMLDVFAAQIVLLRPSIHAYLQPAPRSW